MRSVEPGAAALLRDAWLGGALVAIALFFACIGPRADLGAALEAASFWLKLGYTGLTGWLAWAALRDRGVPGAVVGATWRAALPSACLAVLVTIDVARIAPEPVTWVSASWSRCIMFVLALAAPILAGLLGALRGMASVRMRVTGAIAGLVAGATGATIYALGCGENSMWFVLVFYTLAMVLPAALGALVAPAILRW